MDVLVRRPRLIGHAGQLLGEAWRPVTVTHSPVHQAVREQHLQPPAAARPAAWEIGCDHRGPKASARHSTGTLRAHPLEVVDAPLDGPAADAIRENSCSTAFGRARPVAITMATAFFSIDFLVMMFARPDVPADRVDQDLRRFPCGVRLLRGRARPFARSRGGSWPERLERGRHGVSRCTWAAAGAHRRAGVSSPMAVEILLRQSCPAASAPTASKGETMVSFCPFPESRLDGSGVDEDAWHVDSRHPYHPLRACFLVAAARRRPRRPSFWPFTAVSIASAIHLRARRSGILHALGAHAYGRR